MEENISKQISLWHQFVETKNAEILQKLLANDVKFHSPFIWKPKIGKPMATALLTTVTEVFENFQYVREICDKNLACLEFSARIGDLICAALTLLNLMKTVKLLILK